ncbi:MAG: hypothetical protein K9I94_11875 [Bacteroidales bacterium]|nr:hypothetical protein [Bacteroidales bacterium]
MSYRLPDERVEELLSTVLQSGKIDRERDAAFLVYDLPYLREKVDAMIAAFPKTTLHAIAVKANSNPSILSYLNDTGIGLEAASVGELEIARQSGYSPDKIVFDSPVKSRQEIEFALQQSIHLNADNLMELERIDKTLQKMSSKSNIGLRINPQVGVGTIAITSVSGEYSKFGEPLKENRQKIIEAYCRYPWLNAIHLHVGSQGCDPVMLGNGICKVFELVCEINDELEQRGFNHRIRIFDMGGGLPVSYYRNRPPISMQEYSDMIRKTCPELFDGRFQLITEFGRYVHTNAGFAVSRVEYVKRHKSANTAMIHVGANMFIREAYHPGQWHHEISVADQTGRIKTQEPEESWVVAGPLCFAGDMLERNVYLPPIEEGDYLIIHDSGAYTLSMWSEYNSRSKPRVFGVCGDLVTERLGD